ncbi:hypothetical protein HD806DRAFT_308774 [Xylariaceae sp. AK1471]|nr:hypothetical protein HD806DRAFT_308774 [Xylariaceae sp. AK1471]
MAPKIKKKGPQPTPDLPSLFPTHDGSYGINTLINIDAESKKGHKPNTGIAKEQSDDKQWSKSMKGKTGKKYGMNSDLKKAIGESHQEVEKEHQEQAPINPLNANSSRPSGPSSPSSSSSSSSSSSHSAPSTFGDGDGGPPGPPDDPNSIPPNPHVPKYDPNNPPFSEEPDHRRRPPYTRAALPSLNSHIVGGVNQPASSHFEYIPFYGMPQGEGSDQPISPTRPDTSRSFNYESGLFSNATFRTPGQIPGFGSFDVAKAINRVSMQNPWTRQDTTGGQPNPNTQDSFQPKVPDRQNAPRGTNAPSGQPDRDTSPNSSQQNALDNQKASGGRGDAGGQSDLNTSPDALQQRTPKPPKGPRAPEEKKSKRNQIARASLREKGPQYPRPEIQGQETNSSTGQPRTTNGTRQNPTMNGSGPGRPWSFIRQSAGLICPLVAFFTVLAMVLWAALTAIQALSHDNTSLFNGGFGPSKFSIGASLWNTISGLLPEIPDMHNIPNIPNATGPLDCSNIDYETLLAELKKRMPKAIWAQKDKNGKIKIPEDFWHALKELIKGDDSILTLENSDISDDHWSVIKSRIQTTGFEAGKDGTSKAGASAKDIEHLVENKMSRSWNSWLKQNEQALKKACTGVALTKDDFLKLFKEEAASYQHEIGQELTELRERISTITEHMSRLQDGIDSASGMTKNEIKKVVDSMILKAINNGKLDAVAEGLIKGHANDVLANQVNYFGIGAGATIDPTYTSSAWKIPKHLLKSKPWLDKDGYKAQPPRSALLPWTQEGECFCAGPDLKGHGRGTNNISVITSRNIIPQHLVVEHILPGATLDPSAMPKEIEVWTYIEELTLRNEVRIFSETQFPDKPKEEVLNEGWVKIGHFTYENKNYGDGVQVFKMSDELARMNAITSNIVVRAINNYGADHTCFYQVKLYGEVVERPDDPLEYTRDKKS